MLKKPVTTLCLFFFVFPIFQPVSSIHCYQCGHPNAPDCESSSEWYYSYEKCLSGSFCVKHAVSDVHTKETQVMRGCALKKTLKGDAHQVGCFDNGNHEFSSSVYCFCDEDLCNASEANFNYRKLFLSTMLCALALTISFATL